MPSINLSNIKRKILGTAEKRTGHCWVRSKDETSVLCSPPPPPPSFPNLCLSALFIVYLVTLDPNGLQRMGDVARIPGVNQQIIHLKGKKIPLGQCRHHGLYNKRHCRLNYNIRAAIVALCYATPFLNGAKTLSQPEPIFKKISSEMYSRIKATFWIVSHVTIFN